MADVSTVPGRTAAVGLLMHKNDDANIRSEPLPSQNFLRRAYLFAVRGKKRDTPIEIPRMTAMIRSDTRIGIS